MTLEASYTAMGGAVYVAIVMFERVFSTRRCRWSQVSAVQNSMLPAEATSAEVSLPSPQTIDHLGRSFEEEHIVSATAPSSANLLGYQLPQAHGSRCGNLKRGGVEVDPVGDAFFKGK